MAMPITSHPMPKAGDQFQMAFVTYTGHRWHLGGFYFNAEFVYRGAPTSRTVLKAKVKDLLALKSANSLGKPWIRLEEQRMRQKLEDEAQWLRWKVAINNAMVLPLLVVIPERLFSSSNYRLTRPTEVNAATFSAFRTLATQTSLPEDQDDAFPEGREVLLRHKGRERSPGVVQAAKAKFFQMHARFFCQACGFDFEDFYGVIGHHFIEAHHTVPVSELREDSKTKASDIALVCSNCHRMLHRRRPWIKMSDLEMLLKPQAATT
jgi:hypothetical protein